MQGTAISGASSLPNRYADSFGFQWNQFSRVQLDSANGATYSRRRFLAETGWTENDVNGKLTLDGGCGSGRFAEIAADLGAVVIALDYSSAVEAAARNLAGRPNVHFVRGDLLSPPFKERSLDFAYSIGVMQHTPDPPGAIASVLSLLKPGGRFAFTIYARRWYTRLYGKYLLRPFTTRVPAPTLLRAIEAVMPVAFSVTDVLFRVPVLGKIAQFALPIANYVDKHEFSREQRYQEAILDTFDMLSPAYDQPMTAAEVEQVLTASGVRNFHFGRTVPIEVTGMVEASVTRDGR